MSNDKFEIVREKNESLSSKVVENYTQYYLSIIDSEDFYSLSEKQYEDIFLLLINDFKSDEISFNDFVSISWEIWHCLSLKQISFAEFESVVYDASELRYHFKKALEEPNNNNFFERFDQILSYKAVIPEK